MGKSWVEEAKVGNSDALFPLIVPECFYSKFFKELKCLLKAEKHKDATGSLEIACQVILKREDFPVGKGQGSRRTSTVLDFEFALLFVSFIGSNGGWE